MAKSALSKLDNLFSLFDRPFPMDDFYRSFTDRFKALAPAKADYVADGYTFDVGDARIEDIAVEVEGGRLKVTAASTYEEGDRHAPSFRRTISQSWTRAAYPGEPEATLNGTLLTVKFHRPEEPTRKIEVKKA